jgi:hypothetical protein
MKMVLIAWVVPMDSTPALCPSGPPACLQDPGLQCQGPGWRDCTGQWGPQWRVSTSQVGSIEDMIKSITVQG